MFFKQLNTLGQKSPPDTTKLPQCFISVPNIHTAISSALPVFLLTCAALNNLIPSWQCPNIFCFWVGWIEKPYEF